MNINSEADSVENKYGKLPKTIVHKLQQYEFDYFREDKPVPFCGMHIYPIQVRNFELFSACTLCLTLNKNETAQGIRMSHLDYLISKVQDEKEGPTWSYKFQQLLELTLHITNGIKCKKCGRVMKYDDEQITEYLKKINDIKQKIAAAAEKDEKVAQEELKELSQMEQPKLVCPDCQSEDLVEMIKIVKDPETNKHSLLVDGNKITKLDFDEYRQIVLFQNFPDYVDDSWVDPDLKKDREEKMRLERLNNDVHASIEKKVICLGITTNYKFAEIYDMPIRKFTMALATVDDLISYKITKQAVMSGFVSMPKGKTIEHWIYKPEKDMYGDSYKDSESLRNEVSNL